MTTPSKRSVTPPLVAHIGTRRPRHTCDALGVCQGLDLVCTSCKQVTKTPAHAYAPGTITTEPPSLLGDGSQRRYLFKYLIVSTSVIVGTMLVAGVAGYLWAVAP